MIRFFPPVRAIGWTGMQFIAIADGNQWPSGMGFPGKCNDTHGTNISLFYQTCDLNLVDHRDNADCEVRQLSGALTVMADSRKSDAVAKTCPIALKIVRLATLFAKHRCLSHITQSRNNELRCRHFQNRLSKNALKWQPKPSRPHSKK